jgi:hypothetical protein
MSTIYVAGKPKQQQIGHGQMTAMEILGYYKADQIIDG